MPLEYIDSTNSSRLETWDEFMVTSPRGHYCTLSTWLQSFAQYGFDYRIIACTVEGTIVAGVALLEYRAPGVCILSCPVGPNIREGHEHRAAELLREALDHARARSAILLQLQVPVSRTLPAPRAALSAISLPSTPAPHEGYAFRSGNAPGEMLWLEFPRASSPAECELALFQNLPSRMRRDIRAAERAGVTVTLAATPDERRTAYGLIEETARSKGYGIRPWADISGTIEAQTSRGQAVMLVAKFDERLVAVNYAVLAGQRMTYMMGGSVRLHRNVPVGAALHWNSIRFAIAADLLGYDFGARGPAGVREFKEGFGPQLIEFEAPRYYVLAPVRFQLFTRVYPWLRRHKSTVARLLRRRART